MKTKLIVFLIFLALLIVMTFPLFFDLKNNIPGFFSSDEPYGNIWECWRIKYSFLHNLPLNKTYLIAYPFGVDIYGLGYTSYLWRWLTYFFIHFLSPILIYNFQLLLNLLLSGLFAYLLIYYVIGKNVLAAVFGGIIFAFCPYQFARIWQHFGLTYNQWIPLGLFTAILLKEEDSRKNVFLFFVSLLLILSFDFSVMYFTAITLTMFFIYSLFYCWRIKLFKQRQLLESDLRYFKKVIIAGLFAFVVLLPQFLPIIKNILRFSSTTVASFFNPYHRPFEDLFAQSAKPLGYLLPAATHPIFGKFTEQFVGSQLYGVSFTEHTLYLGWTPLILAFIAFRRWRQERRLRAKSPAWPAGRQEPRAREDFYIGFFVFLAIVAWLFSQPPWWNIFGFKVYMPSFFMYKILPMYRAYCRFGIVVMLAVAVLAGFGLKFILERFKSQKVKIAITCLFSGLVLFEFWNWPPYKVIDVSKVPAAYYWLKEEPGDFAIAEYPLDADSPNEMYKFYQTKHEKKIINGTIPGTYANQIAQTIKKLSEPKTAGRLKWMGVRYALVHRDGYLETELIAEKEELDRIPQNLGLKLVKSFPAQGCPQKDIMCVQKTGPIDVYEVIALPVEPVPNKSK
jgi:hypothetical protein